MVKTPDPDGGAPLPPIPCDDVWNLHARPDLVEAAAHSWVTFAGLTDDAASDVDGPARKLYDGEWSGASADSFDQHRARLVGDVRATGEQARSVAMALRNAADGLRHAQGRLTAEWDALAAVPRGYTAVAAGRQVTFWPTNPGQSRAVGESVANCDAIRAGLGPALAAAVPPMRTAVVEWTRMHDSWKPVVEQAADPFGLPPEVTGVSVLYDGNRVIVNTGVGDDRVEVSVDPKTGAQIVTLNGVQYRYPAGADIVVRTGDGDDSVTVAPGANVRLTVLGGAGDDVVRGGAGAETVVGLGGRDQVYGGGGADRISGGAGRDYLDGQSGNDVMTGGSGDDTVYGLQGDDRLSGGSGQDYLEGGTGKDLLAGGVGADILSGGQDDDTIHGGQGNDVVYTGRGNDTVNGGAGDDTSHADGAGDLAVDVETNVTVEIKDTVGVIELKGSDDFKARIQADLDMLAGSPTGAQMLSNMQQVHDDGTWSFLFLGGEGDKLTIEEYDPTRPENIPYGEDNSLATRDGMGLGHHQIQINPHLDTLPQSPPLDGPPIAILYHEMAHVYDYMNGTSLAGEHHRGVNNTEHQATGLPLDHDADPKTPERIDPNHPIMFTENGLRDEMGAPHRSRY